MNLYANQGTKQKYHKEKLGIVSIIFFDCSKAPDRLKQGGSC